MLNILTAHDAHKMTYESIMHTSSGYVENLTELEIIFNEVYTAAGQGEGGIVHRLTREMMKPELDAIITYLVALGYDAETVGWVYSGRKRRMIPTLLSIVWWEE